MSKSIKLHKEFGVNPSVTTCPICGSETGIAFLGASCKGEAPRHIAGDPCEQCATVIKAGGMLLVEVRDGEEGKANPYRTGYVVGISKECADKIREKEGGPPGHVAYIEESVCKRFMGDMYKQPVGDGPC